MQHHVGPARFDVGAVIDASVTGNFDKILRQVRQDKLQVLPFLRLVYLVNRAANVPLDSSGIARWILGNKENAL